MDEINSLNPQIKNIKQAYDDPWSPVPKVEETITKIRVPKINEHLKEDEFEVEIKWETMPQDLWS